MINTAVKNKIAMARTTNILHAEQDMLDLK